MYIYPYKSGSKSVNALKNELGILAIKRENSKFKGEGDKIVINWGSTVLNEEILKCNVYNKPEHVKLATNKRDFFRLVDGQVNIPPYTEDWAEAKAWFDGGKIVVARHILEGHSAEGLEIVETNYQMETCKEVPLFTQYIPKKDEYRVHVAFGEVIDVQRKAKKHAAKGVNWKVRSHNNGFVFVREGVEPPEDVLVQAVNSIKIVGLDFGAVDVIWNKYRGKAYVLEVNTAPGLEGQTVKAYAEALSQNKKVPKLGSPFYVLEQDDGDDQEHNDLLEIIEGMEEAWEDDF